MFNCPNGDQVPWCVCREDACIPACVWENGNADGWMDPCSGSLLLQMDCRECSLECRHIGDLEREGWYAVCDQAGQDEALVAPGACAPFWECNPGAPEQCL